MQTLDTNRYTAALIADLRARYATTEMELDEFETEFHQIEAGTVCIPCHACGADVAPRLRLEMNDRPLNLGKPSRRSQRKQRQREAERKEHRWIIYCPNGHLGIVSLQV